MAAATNGRTGRRLPRRYARPSDACEWRWRPNGAPWQTAEQCRTSRDGREAAFDPGRPDGPPIPWYSMAVGDRPLALDRLHYWEVKMLTRTRPRRLLAVGVSAFRDAGDGDGDGRPAGLSPPGISHNSAGLSHNGRAWQGCHRRKRIRGFRRHSTVGVLFEPLRGRIAFYVNQRPAASFRCRLRHPRYYPVVASTTPLAAVRLVCSVSASDSLQTRAARALRSEPEAPGLRRDLPPLWLLPPPDDDGDGDEACDERPPRLCDYCDCDASSLYEYEHSALCSECCDYMDDLSADKSSDES